MAAENVGNHARISLEIAEIQGKWRDLPRSAAFAAFRGVDF